MVGCFRRFWSAVRTAFRRNKPGEAEEIDSDDPQQTPVLPDALIPNSPQVLDTTGENVPAEPKSHDHLTEDCSSSDGQNPEPQSRPNLWSKAYAQLPEDVRSDDSFGGDFKDVHQNIQEPLQQLRDKTRSDQRNIKLPNGEKKPIRDIFARTIKWIDKIVGLGSLATPLDPTGGAGIAVGLFTLICEMLLQEQEKWELAMDPELMAHLIYYYARVEDLFLPLDSDNKLNGSLITLYKCVLQYQYAVYKHLKQSTLVAPFNSENLQKLLDEVIQQSQKVNEITQLLRDQRETTFGQDLNELKKIEPPILSIQETVTEVHDIQAEERKSKILDWVSGSGMLPGNFHDTINPQEGTCSWLLRHESYIDWKAAEKPQSLWLKGKLGSGKTNLTAHVIRDLQRSISDDMAFFYCSATIHWGQGATFNADFIRRALLRQLVDKSSPQSLDTLYTNLHTQYSTIPSQDCLNLLQEISKVRSITFVIDALDELDDNIREDLLESLSGRIGSLKIFASTRPTIASDLSKLLPQSYEIDTYDHNAADIESFVGKSVDAFIKRSKTLGGNALNTSERAQIQEVLVQKADGMFRWVELTIEYMKSKFAPNADQVMELLHRLPTKLNDMYEHVFQLNLDRFEDDTSKKLVHWILIWLMYAEDDDVREKSTFQFLLSYQFPTLSKSINADTITLRLCPTLVEFHEETDKFRLAHFSVKEFLVQKEEFKPQDAHGRIAQFAFQTITDLISEEMVPEDTVLTPIDYSLKYWHEHCEKAQDRESQHLKRDVADSLILFHAQGGHRRCMSAELPYGMNDLYMTLARSIIYGHLVVPDDTLGLFIGSLYGLRDLVDYCLDEEHADVNDIVHRHDYSALTFACGGNQRSMAEYLINKGAKVDFGRQSSLFTVAFQYADIDLFQMICDRNFAIDLDSTSTLRYPQNINRKIYGGTYPDLRKKVQYVVNEFKRIDLTFIHRLLIIINVILDINMDDIILDLLSREIEVVGGLITFTEKRGSETKNRERLLSGSQLALESHAVERILAWCLRFASSSMELLIQREFNAWPSIEISNLLLAALERSQPSPTMVKFLLTQRPNLRLSDDILLELLGSRTKSNADELLNMLLDHDRGPRTQSKKVLNRVTYCYVYYFKHGVGSIIRPETLERVVDRCENIVVDNRLLRSLDESWGPDFVLKILQRPGIRIELEAPLPDWMDEGVKRTLRNWLMENKQVVPDIDSLLATLDATPVQKN